MAFHKIEQQRRAGVADGDLRISITLQNGRRMLGLSLAPAVLEACGLQIGDSCALHAGDGEDAGWLRVAADIDGRRLHSLPNSQMAMLRFTLPHDDPMPLAPIQAVPEWREAKGRIDLCLPASLGGPAPAATRLAPAPASPPTAATPAAPSKWTPERNAILRALYPKGAEIPLITERVNELQGQTATESQVRAQAGNLGLKRSVAAPMPAVLPSPPPVAPSPPPPPPPPPARGITLHKGADLPAEHKDKAEAVNLLEAGMSGRAVAEEMGLPLDLVSGWAAEVRERQKRARSATA